MHDSEHSDDDLTGLVIAILADHADYMPLGLPERLASTVLTHLKSEGWRQVPMATSSYKDTL